MAKPSQLRNAPITEAMIDFRVALPKEFRADSLRRAQSLLKSEFPKCLERKGFKRTLGMREGQPVMDVQDLGFIGVWLKSEDERTIAQFRVDGFTLSRLRPYTSWEQVLSQGMRAWSVYTDLAKPQSVTRIAVRYINHLPLPAPPGNLDDYILTRPRLPPSVPQSLSGFTTKVVLEDRDRRMTANVVQVLEVGLEATTPTLVFDIEAVRAGDFGVAVAGLTETLQDLRNYKNEIFFGSLTDKMVEKFS